jgi:hypothetical protein
MGHMAHCCFARINDVTHLLELWNQLKLGQEQSYLAALRNWVLSLFCHSPGRQSPEALSVNQYKLSY